MKMGRGFWVAILLGCFATGDAIARKPNLRSVKNFLVERSSGIKQWGVSIVTACSLMSVGCNPATTIEKHIDPVHYWHKHSGNADLNEIVAELKQIEGARIGVIKRVDHDELSMEIYDGAVYLQLSRGEFLVNNSDLPVKIILSEEIGDERSWSWGDAVLVVVIGGAFVGLVVVPAVLSVVEVVIGVEIFPQPPMRY